MGGPLRLRETRLPRGSGCGKTKAVPITPARWMARPLRMRTPSGIEGNALPSDSAAADRRESASATLLLRCRPRVLTVFTRKR